MVRKLTDQEILSLSQTKHVGIWSTQIRECLKLGVGVYEIELPPKYNSYLGRSTLNAVVSHNKSEFFSKVHPFTKQGKLYLEVFDKKGRAK